MLLPVHHFSLHALYVVHLSGDAPPGDGVAGVGQQQRGDVCPGHGHQMPDGRLVRINGWEVGLDGLVVDPYEEEDEEV